MDIARGCFDKLARLSLAELQDFDDCLTSGALEGEEADEAAEMQRIVRQRRQYIVCAPPAADSEAEDEEAEWFENPNGDDFSEAPSVPGWASGASIQDSEEKDE